MATFEKTLMDHMTKNGMFESQAKEVMESFKLMPANESMKSRWNDNVEDYDIAIPAGLILFINYAVVKWIEENLPMAWYKPMFQQ